MFSLRKDSENNSKRTDYENQNYSTISQGGVCSPLMWNLVANELLNSLTAFGAHCIGYVDNIVITAKGKFERILGLSINSAESTIVLFTRKRKISNMIKNSFGTVLTPLDELKLLSTTCSLLCDASEIINATYTFQMVCFVVLVFLGTLFGMFSTVRAMMDNQATEDFSFGKMILKNCSMSGFMVWMLVHAIVVCSSTRNQEVANNSQQAPLTPQTKALHIAVPPGAPSMSPPLPRRSRMSSPWRPRADPGDVRPRSGPEPA
ncbi:hypothetical protein Trydic_g19694 [Trypoxylus dichotomus]